MHPARFKNIDGSCHVVANRGYIVMKMVEYNNETEEMNYTNTSDFILSP